MWKTFKNAHSLLDWINLQKNYGSLNPSSPIVCVCDCDWDWDCCCDCEDCGVCGCLGVWAFGVCNFGWEVCELSLIFFCGWEDEELCSVDLSGC